MTVGIYCLKFTGTDKVYIGQSNNIENRRLKEHLNSFKNETASKKLLQAYKEHGTPSLEILHKCNDKDLNSLEDHYIEKLNAVDNGFNTYYSHNQAPVLYGEDNGFSKYTNEQVISVFKLLVNNVGKSLKDISSTTKVSIDTVRKISCLNEHTWLSSMFPEEYKVLAGLKGTRKTAEGRGIVYPPIKDTNGVIYTNIKNMREFAKEHGLDTSNLCNVLKGKRKSHKGWKLV